MLEGRRPRISVEIDWDLHGEMNQHVPWGLKTRIYTNLTKAFIDACSRYGDEVVIAAALRGNIKVEVENETGGSKKKHRPDER